MTPASIMFALAGSPPQDGAAPVDGARCRVCGHPCARAMAYNRFQGQNFTDQNKLRDWSSDLICEPCVWAHAWNVPPGLPPPAPGKKGLNLRLFSHFWHDGQYHAWNKANKREMRDWLRAPKTGPWFAAIAESGQKHVLPWTPLNRGMRGAVRFEEATVRVGDLGMIDAMSSLLTAGATKEEIETGHYGPRAWQLAQAPVEWFEEECGRAGRGGQWFALALWLAQRDEDQVAERVAAESAAKEKKRANARPDREAARGDRARAPRRARGVSADESRESAQTLGPAAGPDADGSSIELGLGRVDHDAAKVAGTGGAKQHVLWGD